MTRTATAIFLVFSLAAGGVVYGLAERTTALRAELTALQADSVREREAIHVLRAEWSLLNNPQRLAVLAGRFLGMRPMTVAQFVPLSEIPRPVGARLASTPPAMPAERARGAWDVIAAARPLPRPHDPSHGRGSVVARNDGAPAARSSSVGTGPLLIAAGFEP